MAAQEFEKIVLRQLLLCPNDNKELHDQLMEKYSDDIEEILEIEWKPRDDVYNYILDDRNSRLTADLLDSPSSPSTSTIA